MPADLASLFIIFVTWQLSCGRKRVGCLLVQSLLESTSCQDLGYVFVNLLQYYALDCETHKIRPVPNTKHVEVWECHELHPTACLERECSPSSRMQRIENTPMEKQR